MNRSARGLLLMAVFGFFLTGCDSIPRGSTVRNDLSKMKTLSIPITNRTTYTAYVADTDETEQLGLMNVKDSDLPDNYGMIFVFPQDRSLNFWMRNTIIPLTAAFIADDGSIVNLADMKPQTTDSHCSTKPVRFVLEMNQGWFAKKGVKAGFRLGGAPFSEAAK